MITLTDLINAFNERGAGLGRHRNVTLVEENGVRISADTTTDHVQMEFVVNTPGKYAIVGDLDVAYVVFDYMRNNK